MNFYSLLPLAAFFANTVLGFFIFFKNPKSEINKLYALVTFSWAIWALGDFLVFISPSAETALLFNKLATIGAATTSVMLIDFFLIFSKTRISRKAFCMISLPSLTFLFIGISTNLISKGTIPSQWGYYIVRGPLYLPFTFYIITYTIASILIGWRFYRKSKSDKERAQSKFLIIATLLPVFGGIGTQVIPEFLGFEMIRLTTTLTIFSAAMIAFAILKHELMSITPTMAAEKIIDTMSDYLLVADEKEKTVFVNSYLLKSLGHEQEWLMGQPANLVFSDKGIVKEIFQEIRKSGSVSNREAEIFSSNQKTIPVSINGSSISDRGKAMGFILIMRDISESKNLINRLEQQAEELKKSKEELEKKVFDMERFSKLAVGRELKMIELKKRIKELEARKKSGDSTRA